MPRFLTVFMFCVSSICMISQSYANLLISPTRVAFEDRSRTEQVILINQSDAAQTYRLEWVEQTMTDSGQYVELTEDQEFNRASDLIRYSPRQVTLQPGERQVIKLLARRPAGLANGEYRSHLKFTAIPSDLNSEEEQIGQGMAMKLHLFLSYAIPVIVKKGEEKASASLEDVNAIYTDAGQRLQVTLSKRGNFGVSGDLVAYQKNSVGNEEVVARLNNVNLFHETNSRQVALIPIDKNETISGEVLIRFEGKYEFLGNTLSEAVFRI